MGILEKIRDRASKNLKRIVLPESNDERPMEAARLILDNKISKLIVIGDDSVRKKIKSKNTSLLEVIDPKNYKDIERIAAEYYELRKLKGMTLEEAHKTVLTDYLTFGAMLVKEEIADGFVAGASHTTPSVIRVALRCLAVDREIGVVSGAFLMEVPNCPYGENGVFIFADCGVNPQPNSRQLAGIAVSSAALFQKLVGKRPAVAFLSYSSKGSAEGELVDKIREAVTMAKEIAPEMLIDGEFQADSAIVPEVAKIKCGDNPVAGRANVLIFPNLDSGNISYKLTQRLANARAIGPLLQGFRKPASDLSRGCSAEDIVDAVAVTAVMA
ncbi:MAG: phosphate acetyltransferase [Omnitrophica bacterium RIFCSPLOWO2_02_FULL_45_16]|nr:MAG: phosphate acetyltransferase [Omnitrophica bacterium RIFCSPHIGHO2_02_FULL_46_20]OGW93791.1 MAG: phosphate acetyltransferase [Omnitrophica bacterium RIFCSPLOWO2_01_FULL_45_24]OGW94136.1 MAG: phosphate acetyltransferase [Omnitrophica bacterium RIFCSPLOWO2_12_FULL_45_13]OGX00804.1 MAG: phosphate acetyltransferase [Omnitrophica bacterium RIFCSPLOWO2_02_FULL_45_16]